MSNKEISKKLNELLTLRAQIDTLQKDADKLADAINRSKDPERLYWIFSAMGQGSRPGEGKAPLVTASCRRGGRGP